MPYDYDLFVIGGGSGGVRCARIAAGHGARVAVAEERHWGGTCVNIGCVPKKIMVQAAEYGAFAEDAARFGWHSDKPVHDWAALKAARDGEVHRLTGIYEKLLKSSGVTAYNGRAIFRDAHTVEVDGKPITAEHIVIAVGGAPVIRPPIPGSALGIVSDDAFGLPSLPKRVLIVGSGYIGVEFAQVFSGLGAKVEMAFRQDLPLRGFEPELRKGLAAAMQAQGLKLHANCTVNRVEAHGAARIVTLSNGHRIETDLVFFALGRAPNVEGLGLDRAGVQVAESGSVIVDAENTTSQKHIYAVGDVSNTMNLTPVAIAEGHRLADRLFGKASPRAWSPVVPTAVFSVPPIATCGLTEQEAAKNGPADIYVAEFTPMRHTISGRTDRRTIMKLVVDQASDRVVGAHMLGDDAPEMMQGLAIAMNAGATKADFDRTVGIHPTAAEEWVTLRTRTRVAEPGLAQA